MREKRRRSEAIIDDYLCTFRGVVPLLTQAFILKENLKFSVIT